MSTATARIIVGAEVEVVGLTPAAESEIVAACTFDNPDLAHKRRMDLWTGATPETIETWRRTASGIMVPRGVGRLVLDVCRMHGLVHAIENRTVRPPLDRPLVLAGQPFEYQRQALATLRCSPTGMAVAPPGAGKTFLAMALIAELQTPTLVRVHTSELLRQWKSAVQEFLGIEAATIGGGHWNIGDVTIGMIQTLAARDLSEITGRFGLTIDDECHRSPARTHFGVINQFSARFRHALTATPFRKDGLQMLMTQAFGPIMARINPADVVRAGRILDPEIETVETTFRFDLQCPTDWTHMLTALVRDGDRNALIANEVRSRQTPDTKTLVLTDRVEHVYRLANLLDDLDPVVLVGEMSKTDRESAMAEVRNGAALTIATTGLLGEGVDCPQWNVLFLASPFAGGSKTVQAVGRVCRSSPGKLTATVIDLVDVNVPALVGARRSRVRVLGRAA